MNTPEFLQKTDWKLLKKQKQSLLAIIEWNKLPFLKDDLEGLLNFIDAAQDYAVDVMKIDEKTVFNQTNDEG